VIWPGKTSVGVVATVRLSGERVYLRPARPEDWREWAELRAASRAFLAPWEPTWPADALARAAFLRRIRRHGTEWREDQGYSFLTFSRRENCLVGGIGLTQIRRGVAQTGVIGYWVGQPYAGQGFTTEATQLVLGFAFEHLGLHRVEAACLPSNAASIAVLEKAGFKREGFARGYLRIAGNWADHLLYGIVHEDWRG